MGRITWLFSGGSGYRRGGRRMSTSEKFDWGIDTRLTSYGGATRLGQSPPIWVEVSGCRSIHVTM